MIDPFEELKIAENMLEEYKPSNNADLDYTQLKALLAQERMLDFCRTDMLKKTEHDSSEVKDYMLREYAVRRNISEFALNLSKEVTDRIVGEDPAEKSFVAICIKNRELYPEPAKNA